MTTYPTNYGSFYSDYRYLTDQTMNVTAALPLVGTGSASATTFAEVRPMSRIRLLDMNVTTPNGTSAGGSVTVSHVTTSATTAIGTCSILGTGTVYQCFNGSVTATDIATTDSLRIQYVGTGTRATTAGGDVLVHVSLHYKEDFT